MPPATSENAGWGVTGKLRDVGRFILKGEWPEHLQTAGHVASDNWGPFEHRLDTAGSTACLAAKRHRTGTGRRQLWNLASRHRRAWTRSHRTARQARQRKPTPATMGPRSQECIRRRGVPSSFTLGWSSSICTATLWATTHINQSFTSASGATQAWTGCFALKALIPCPGWAWQTYQDVRETRGANSSGDSGAAPTFKCGSKCAPKVGVESGSDRCLGLDCQAVHLSHHTGHNPLLFVGVCVRPVSLFWTWLACSIANIPIGWTCWMQNSRRPWTSQLLKLV